MTDRFVPRDAALTSSRLEAIGKRLAAERETAEDLELLEGFQRHLRRITRDIYPSIVAAVQEHWYLEIPATERPRKRLVSIRRKLQREKTRLPKMQDLVGCRMIAASQLEANEVCQIVRETFEGELRYRDGAGSGYRGVHYLIQRDGFYYEVQIRTDMEDAWAQLCESLDERYPGAKYAQGPAHVTTALKNLADEVHRFDEARDLAIHEAAGDDREVEPALMPELRLPRRRIDVLIAQVRELLL